MKSSIQDAIKDHVVLGDGGYLIELERRGYVDSGSCQEEVGTGKGSGQFTPQVAVHHPQALRQLHGEFLRAGSQVLQALTFFGTREKLSRAGYGDDTETINRAAVHLARQVAGNSALVAGSVSRTQLLERDGPGSLDMARDHIKEQISFLKAAGVDFLILETFFHLAEMKVALQCAATAGLPAIATMSFRPLITSCGDGHTPATCARVMEELGAIAVGANCEQGPQQMLPLIRQMRSSTSLPLAAQPAAFQTSERCHSFTRLPEFPDDLETIQLPRRSFQEFGKRVRAEGIGYVGCCCGANAAYVHALADGLEQV